MNRLRAPLAATAILLTAAWAARFEGAAPSPVERMSLRFPDREMAELREGNTKEEGHILEMFEWWYGQRAFPNAEIPADAWGRAVAYAREALAPERPDGTGPRGSGWTSLGPDNIGGRVLALAVDPAAPSRLWAGMAAGGLWLSTTAGAGADAWDLIDTGFPTVSVSTIVIDPADTNRMWIGTGEIGRYNRGQVGTPGARSGYGLGVVRSTDGGATWLATGLDWTFDQNRCVQRLQQDPVTSSVLWAATTEGVYKSTDSGATWALSNGVLMAMDLVIDPSVPNTVYASHGQLGVPDDTQAGIWRTTDGGTSWTRLGGGLPTTNFGRTALTAYESGAGPTVVYAGVSSSTTRQVVGLYRTTNAGATWTLQSSQNWASSQAWYDNVIAVHPTNANLVLCAGLDMWRTTNGGGNLTDVTAWYLGYDFVVPAGGPEGPPDYIHADSHAIVFDPVDPSIVYVGTDGGVFRSTDSGVTWDGRNGGLVTTQFYAGFANGYTTQDLALGGLQDNGTIKYLGTPSWSKVFGGDGGWCAIDPSNENVLYEEYVYANMYKSTDGGNNWFEIHPLNSSVANFIAPFVLSESSPNVLYVGQLAVEKSTNGGASWSYTGGSSNWNGTPVCTIGVSFTSPDTALAATGSSAATATFELRRTVNGSVWTDVTAGLPNRYLTDIAYDPNDSRDVWISFSGYGTPHVFSSTDAGASWTDRTANLPDIPCQAIAVDPVDPAHVYVGTDLGVYRTTDGGASWHDFSAGMPPAMVTDLVFKKDDRLLRCATFGNGVYERDITSDPTGVPVVAAAGAGLELSAPAPNPFRTGTSLALALPREGNVTAVVYDASGRRVRTLADGVRPAGTVRLDWDGADESGRRAAAGAYFVKVRAGGEVRSAKVTLLR